MAPKMMGAWNLHLGTADLPLDFFVMFSSLGTMIGSAGQANYHAGNAFLDSLAYYRRLQGSCAVSVNLGALGEVGHVAASQEIYQKLSRLGAKTMPLSEALDALDEIISSDAVQVALAVFDWKQFIRTTGARIPGRLADLVGEIGSDERSSTADRRVRDILEAEEAARSPLLETYLRDGLARAIQASPAQIDTAQPLFNLGLDSLIAVELRNRINADLGVNVPMAKFKQGASIRTLTAYLAEQLRGGESGKRSADGGNEISAAPEDIPLSGEHAAELLERIEEMSDEEVDRRLSVLAAQGNG